MSSDSGSDSAPVVKSYTQPYQLTHKRSCKYCYGLITDGCLIHDECKSDFEWEQNMKMFNAHWKPATSYDYLECM